MATEILDATASVDTAGDTVVETAVDTVVDSVTADESAVEVLVDDELLVEEISIDGMCGVY